MKVLKLDRRVAQLPEANAYVSHILGRVHVSERLPDVLRYVISKLRAGAWQELDRKRKRLLIGQVCRQHLENRGQYLDVMSGFRGPRWQDREP